MNVGKKRPLGPSCWKALIEMAKSAKREPKSRQVFAAKSRKGRR